jgi:serine/threonine protein phosphatase PrpC
MTRSIGDVSAHAIGVSAEPEFCSRRLQLEDKFLILASDGIWDYLGSQEVVDLVRTFYEKGKLEKA